MSKPSEPGASRNVRPTCAADACFVGVRPELEHALRVLLQTFFCRHRLTTQQERLVIGVSAGLGNPQLAAWTGWTVCTVETYLKGRFLVLGVHRREELFVIVLGEVLAGGGHAGRSAT